jgi:hypothetical protein
MTLYIQKFKPRVMGCFFNAALYVAHFDPSAKYVEGVVERTYHYPNGRDQTVKIEHGWAADKLGRVVEVTWAEESLAPLGHEVSARTVVYVPKRAKTRSQLMRMKTFQRAYADWVRTDKGKVLDAASELKRAKTFRLR